MSKGNKTADASTNWYEMWMNQSKSFFESANKNLNDLFASGAANDPQAHIKQINDWLESLKQQWQSGHFTDGNKMYEQYFQQMSRMCSEASEMMVREWIKRSNQQNAIKNIRELYEVWLNCCSEIYKKSLRANADNEAYTDFMNQTFKYWQSMMGK